VKWPYTPEFADGDPLDAYMEHMDREGIDRAVLVQPGPYWHEPGPGKHPGRRCAGPVDESAWTGADHRVAHGLNLCALPVVNMLHEHPESTVVINHLAEAGFTSRACWRIRRSGSEVVPT